MIDLADIILLTIALFCFVLTIFVYVRNSNNPANIAFSIFIFNAAIWPISFAFFRMAGSFETALFWNRVIYLCGTITPLLFIFFVYYFVDKAMPKVLPRLLFVGIPTIYIIFLLFSKLFITSVVIGSPNNLVVLGPIYLSWVVYYAISMSCEFRDGHV
jgi:hypothetical protein